jgi:hypothetical protein
MNTIKIKGKDYVTVNERIKYLASNNFYSITTEYWYYPERLMWVVKATLKIDENTYTGLAQEIESSNYKDVNYTSALENAETSAVGRACAFAGIGIDAGIASADEVNKAIKRGEVLQQPISEEQKMYLITLLEQTTYDEVAKERLASRIESFTTQAEFDKALLNLEMNRIEDKDRIAMGMPYNQSDITKHLKNLEK